MTNRLAELEDTLSRLRERRRKTTRPAPSAATALSRYRRRGRRRRRYPSAVPARALTAIDYTVPGLVPVIAQPTKNSCWATTFTMLWSWKNNESLGIEKALAEVGTRWLQLFKADTGIYPKDEVDFLAQTGLVAEPHQSLSIDGWEQTLRDYGPVEITTDEKPGKLWAIHARLVTAIKGDGTPGGTYFTIIDPDGGREYRESIKTFIPKYEEEIRRTGYSRSQLIHWPKNARVATAQRVRAQAAAKGDTEPDDRDWYLPEDVARPDSRARSWVLQKATARDASWASDAESPDYRHLAASGVSQSFSLTAGHLQRLVAANHFSLGEGPDEILFGLRGCRLTGSPSNNFAAQVSLSEDLPDHDEYHCVLGVWKRSEGKLAVFPGSTVPNWYHMDRQRTRGGQKANMLLTGRHAYTVGNHEGKYRKVLGAFLQQPDAIVVRTNDDLTYETGDFFERHSPADNIHPGFSPSYGASFSSAGCQTVPGSYDESARKHSGEWSKFRRAAGLGDDVRSKLGQRYAYVLLTGREARLAASGAPDSAISRLRFGSRGAAVTALQQALTSAGVYSGPIDGEMGMNTTWAFIRHQQKTGAGTADGIVTPQAAQQLGVDLIAQQSAAPQPGSQSVAVPEALAESFDLRHEVQLVPQQTGMSCWAAAAAMLVGWRDRVSVDPSEIPRAIGYWAQYKDGLHAEDETMFKAWGLTPEVPKSYSVQGFRELLESYGPLWVAAASPGPHVRVVTGLSGDGTPEGTRVHINDPLEKGMKKFKESNKGAVYTETYSEFVRRQATLAEREERFENAVYVAHLGESGRRRLAEDAQSSASAAAMGARRYFTVSMGFRDDFEEVTRFQFDERSFEVTDTAKIQLLAKAVSNDVQQLFRKQPYRLEVHGWASQEGDRGRNQTLAEKRASSVKTALEGALAAKGVSKYTITAEGKGEGVQPEARYSHDRVAIVYGEKTTPQTAQVELEGVPKPSRVSAQEFVYDRLKKRDELMLRAAQEARLVQVGKTLEQIWSWPPAFKSSADIRKELAERTLAIYRRLSQEAVAKNKKIRKLPYWLTHYFKSP